MFGKWAKAKVSADLAEANAFAQKVVAEKGLTVLEDESPTDYQVGIATLHGREDAALLVSLQVKALTAQYRAIYWLQTVAVLLVIVLMNMR
jgi:hypothetical protein